MKILFDHCTPQGLKEYLQEHELSKIRVVAC